MPIVVLGDWNDTTPEAPAGYDLAHCAVDRSGDVPLFSVAVPRATALKHGTVILDASGSATKYLGADGNWHDVPTGGGTGGSGSDIEYAEDTGAANAYAVTLSDATLTVGRMIVMKVANANTSVTATLAVNGGTPVPIIRNSGTRLGIGDIGPGDMAVIIFDGTNFQLLRYRTMPYAAPMPLPLVSDFTQVNAAPCTLRDDPDALFMNIPNLSSPVSWRLLVQDIPATPFTALARIYSSQPTANSSDVGIYFTDGTKLLGLELLAQAASKSLRLQKITNVTTDSATVTSIASPFQYTSLANAAAYLRLRHDGATLWADYSSNQGITWTNLASIAVSAWLTPTKVGFGGACVTSVTSNFVELHLSGWSVTAGAGF